MLSVRLSLPLPKTSANMILDEFAVDDIDKIQWSQTLFQDLTIPDEQRCSLMALAKTWMGLVPTLQFDDFVAGKGCGLNVLL